MTTPTTSTTPHGPVALLDAIVRDALDPSYAEAAARHRAERAIAGDGGDHGHGLDARSWVERWRRTSLVGIVLLVGAGALAGIAVSSEQRVIPQVSAARSALAGSADAQTKQVRALEQTLAARQRDVTALQQEQLAASATGRSLQSQDATLSAAAAESVVHGPGITVTVADAGAAGGTGGATGPAANRPQGSTAGEVGQVTDRDLQDIVNAIWASGAQAVSVGGVRLGPQTAIRTAGQTILVAFQPLQSPYVIRAVGGAALAAAGRSGALLAKAGDPYVADLAVRVQINAALTLPAATPAHISAGHPLPPIKAGRR